MLNTPTPWRVVGATWRSKGKGELKSRASIRLCGAEPDTGLIITGLARTPDEMARFREDVRLIVFAVNKLSQMRTAITRIRALYDELRSEAPTSGEGWNFWCWHCGVGVVKQPLAHCERCPDECDIENCNEQGCRLGLKK